MGGIFNEILTGRFNSLLVRTFGMKIPGAAAPSLAPEIAPNFDVNQQDDPALFFLRGERLAVGFGNQGVPGAGLYAYCAFSNPTNSGTLAVLKRFSLFTNTAGEVYGLVTPQAPVLGGALSNNRQFRERRWGQTVAQPACGPVIGTSATQPSTFAAGQCFYHQVAAGFTNTKLSYDDVGIVLPPGFQFILAHNTVATPTLLCEWWWSERPIPQEELATG